MECLSKLKETELPPIEKFYSKLKKKAMAQEDYDYLKKVWEEKHFKSIHDLLVWYNNADVETLCTALGTHSKIYQEAFSLDMFKDAKSIPGLALRHLFQNLPSDVYFSVFNKKHSDVHTLLRDQMVGGPSIVFNRHQEANKTTIRGQKTTKSVQGYDANSLYLWCKMQQMPTEHPIRRRKENGFKAEYVDTFGFMAREWLEWKTYENRQKDKDFFIRHKFNGRERQLGKRHIRVDGWDGKKAYQFHGCMMHGHDCHLTQGKTHHPFKNKTLDEVRIKTNEITHYLENEVGVEVEELWECEWKKMKKDKNIATFLKKRQLTQKSVFGFKKDITKEDILTKVKSGSFFGLVQCDIHVPEHLKSHFEDMPPIFKNADITIDDIGEHMRDYCVKNKIFTQPRKALIGSYFGNEILLSTPLLQWYLNMGLEVTDVQQILEYKPKACFESFGEDVTAARRQGDKDTNSSILADTQKLLGNSGKYWCYWRIE